MAKQMGHVIISGGSSGIGLAIAELVVLQGHHVTLLARQENHLKAAQALLQKKAVSESQQISYFTCDVSQQGAVEKAVAQAVENAGPPSCLYLSAGIVEPGHFMDLTIEQFKRTMDVNYMGSVHVIKSALPYMVKQAEGSITLISSAAGLIGVWGYGAYSPTKFALHGLAEVLRAEMKPKGVSVSIAFPPDTDTPQYHGEKDIRPQETTVIAGTADLWTAQDVAKVIVSKSQKKRFLITPGLMITALSYLRSLIFPVLSFWFDQLVKRKCP
ncbi:SDR family oxidoreductase [Terasakiella pusilla]|uniref:SDR family oxidoreductase n=1 Tax=Terasakiella pusilla TaxID=64973 RepID=UPI000491A4B0|nr:SDR family oxidoreductase [Terasakiella pusilla]